MTDLPRLDLDAIEEEPSCVFVLRGREWHCRSGEDVGWGSLEKSTQVDANDPTKAAVHVRSFFEAVLAENEVEEFLALLSDPLSGLSSRRIEALTQFVAEKVFKRPTERPSASLPGPEPSVATSRARSSGRATPRKRSVA